MFNKKEVESILKSLILYRLSLMERIDEYSENYIDSLSHTGYILEIIKNQSFSEDIEESTKVSFDMESFLNIYDILVYQINTLNKSIIDNLEIDNSSVIADYKLQKETYQALYEKINVRRVNFFKQEAY